jgi:hypothetical protein
VPDAGSRPVARAVLIKLLGQHDLSSGLLAEGSRRARAAARLPEPSPPSGQPAIRSRSGAVLWAMAFAVCVLAIVAAAVFIFRPHRGPATQPGALTTDSPPAHATRLPRPLPTASAPAVLAGNWSGAVHQTSPALTASVRISLPAGSARGTIAYPGLGCSGTLAIVSVVRDRLTLDQTISSGRNNCPDGVITLVSGPGGTVAFTFLRPGGGNPAGTLTRRA